MADLIAIGYPDEDTAAKAMREAEHLAEELIIQPDAIAAIVRGKDGKFKVTTNHHEVGGGATWGMWWGFLFGLLFFVPSPAPTAMPRNGTKKSSPNRKPHHMPHVAPPPTPWRPGPTWNLPVVERAPPAKAAARR